MSILPQRQYGLYITLGLAVVGAIVAGIILITSGKASETDLSTARYVPEDAGLYIGVNTDLASDQWIAAFDLIERLGQDDPEQELQDSAEDADVDWEDEVVPFLGGNAGFYLSFADTDDPFSSLEGGAVIFKANDPEAAIDVIEDQLGADFDSDEYRGAETFVDEEVDIFAAIHDGHLIVAASEAALYDTIDAGAGQSPRLADVEDFRNLRDELSKNFLVFVYINAEALLEDFLDEDGDIYSQAFEEAGVYDLLLHPNAYVIGAKENAFEGQHAALAEPGAVGPLTEPRESRLAELVPAETAVFVSTQKLAQTYHDSVDAAGEEIDDAISENSDYDDLDEALEDAGEEIGIDNLEELIDLFTGEVAVAFWFPTDDEDEPEVVFLAEVEDDDDAMRIMEDIIEESGNETGRQDIGDAEVIFFEDDDGDEFGVTVLNGIAYLGTEAGLEAVLEPDGDRLTDNDRYTEAVDSLPTALGTYVYFDLAALLRLEEEGIPAELDEAEEALEGAIINVVNERNVVRTSGVLTIK